jgi:beta-mannosidase
MVNSGSDMLMRSEPSTIDLAGTWTLRDAAAGDGEPVAMPIPGDAISALRDAGRIPNPYVGRNEYDVRWVAERDWIVSRDFDLTGGDTDGWYLDIEGLDTVAEIILNGVTVLRAANSFRRYRPNVGHALKQGENRLDILFRSNLKEAARRQAVQPFFVPWHEGNSPLANGNMLRKPQCHFGWDWNLAVAPFGLYGTIALKRLDIARIEHVTVRQSHDAQTGAVTVTASIEFHANQAGMLPLTIEFDGERNRVDCAVSAGRTICETVFEVAHPKLWWPAGSGPQHLYTLVVETPTERVARHVGLRVIDLLTDKDEAGSRFAFRINGREIFCRGANWIPADALFSGATEEKVTDLLTSARDAHMNMIRVWGGGFYETEHFYETCDRLGLMVWQDFMFACNLYPSTPDFLAEVEAEVEYQVKRLSSHACLALWCGDNELVGALTWFEASVKNRDRYLVSYDRLNHLIERTLKQAAPDALWWPSSPSAGPLDFGDAWHDDGAGDMHVWSVWHEGKDFAHYRTLRPRFCSEFGFQSFPSLPVIEGFAGPADLNIASPVMEAHQKNAGGNARIAETLFRYVRFPKDFANFLYASQIQQGLAIKTAVDWWRSLKPHCMGTLYWQLNDTWPVASWSSLNHDGSWKALHHMARRFFQPVTVATIPDADGRSLRFCAVNDTAELVTVSLTIEALSITGARRELVVQTAGTDTDAAYPVASIDLASLRQDEIIIYAWEASNGMAGRDHVSPRPYKALDLPQANVAFTFEPDGDATLLHLTTDQPAFFVAAETAIAGRFSDNVVDLLLPGEARSLRFMPRDSGRKLQLSDFRIYDLQSAAGLG